MMHSQGDGGDVRCGVEVEEIVRLKKALWRSEESPEKVYERLVAAVEREVGEIVDAESRGERVIPEVNYADIVARSVPEATVKAIKHRGTAIIRGVVNPDLVERWALEAESYVTTENDYHASGKAAEEADKKNFFAEATPQIYGVYWSKPQTEARQHPNMQTARAFLNSLWSHVKTSNSDSDAKSGSGEEVWAFDPSKEATYADRLRIRHPGNVSGLVPHVDGGTIERWVDKGYQEYYRKVFEGKWEEFDPWAGEVRVNVEELPSPNVCTVFRTYQGWLATSKQGKGDGTLQVVPLLKESTAHLLVRPFLSDVGSDDPLCGAFEGKQHKILSQWHEPLLKGLISIPEVNPGDTVWWHPDIIHAVEKVHTGTGKASVFYIGAAPLCVKNAQYLKQQRESFLTGEAGPDFPQEEKEKDWNRATLDDLTLLGKQQLGFTAWELTGTESAAQTKLINDATKVIS